VIFVSIVAGPALPKSVWLEAPPKVDPMDAPLPTWRSTAIIIMMLAITWIIVVIVANMGLLAYVKE